MSQNHPNASSSNFQLVFNAALDAYEKKTNSKLVLAVELQSCDSLPAIISEFEELVQQFDRRRKSDQSLTKWLNPTVKVLYALSEPLGKIAGLVSLT
jgi:mannitol-1-phosphate/altronate dehydrogenase